LKEKGTTAHLLDGMMSLHECFDTVGLTAMLAEDAKFAADPAPLPGG
jgi:hypothetical protein